MKKVSELSEKLEKCKLEIRDPLFPTAKQRAKLISILRSRAKINEVFRYFVPTLVSTFLLELLYYCITQSLLRYEDAYMDWSLIINLEREASYYTARAKLLLKLNRPSLALDDYGIALNLHPTNSEIYFQRAEAYYYGKQYETALSGIYDILPSF